MELKLAFIAKAHLSVRVLIVPSGIETDLNNPRQIIPQWVLIVPSGIET